MKPALRHRSRKFAMQSLYAWQMTRDPIQQIAVNITKEHDSAKFDHDYLNDLIVGVTENAIQIDTLISSKLEGKREITELTAVELAVLRIACFEFLYKIDVPYRVVINEALEINKKFGTNEGFRFVNGVLDNLAKEIRNGE